MKKNAVKDLREKNAEALGQLLEEKLKDLFTLRTQAVTQKIDNPHAMTQTRHEIARIKTLLREKELETQKQTASA